MVDKFDYRPGEYKVIVDRLRVRGTPNTADDGNIVKVNGNEVKLTNGQSFPVYRIVTTKIGWVWGIINQADKDHYVCLWNLNTRFAELVKLFEETAPTPIEKKSDIQWLHERLQKVENWARTKGYQG